MNLEQQVKHLDKHYRDGNALVSDKTSEYDEIKKRKEEIIEDLYAQIGELNRVWNEQELELTTKEYICKFDELKQRIHELEK